MATSLERLRLLQAVATRGSIAAAARHAGYTPSAVSQQLAHLEREVGASLFERSNRGVVLTPAGVALSDRAAVVLDLVDAAVAEAAGSSTPGAIVPLRIGAFPTAISELVLPAVARLTGSVRLTIVDLEPGDALGELLARTLDAALVDRYDNQPNALHHSLRTRTLLVEPVRLIARTRTAAPRRLSDLADAGWVLGSPTSRLGRATRAICHAAGFEPRIVAESDDHRVAFDIVRSTGATTIQPELTLAERPRRITALALDLGCSRSIDLVTRATHGAPLDRLAEALRSVVDARG